MDQEEHLSPFCPYYHHAVEVIGRRWTGAILRALFAGKTRFGELRAAIPDLSDRMLSERLKELEHEGIVERSVVPDMPVRIDYRLTPKGEALQDVIGAIARWAHAWVSDRDIQEQVPESGIAFERGISRHGAEQRTTALIDQP